MKRTIILLLITVIALSGCTRKTDAKELFERFSSRYELPPGIIFDTAATELSEQYISDETYSALYARADGSNGREHIVRAVIWLGSSSQGPYEAAFFVCTDRGAAEQVAALCMTRADMIRRANASENKTNPEVRIFGAVTVMIMLPDNDAAWRIVERIL